MSSEKINQNSEKERPLSEALEQAGAERREELEKLRETIEQTPEKNVDDARREVEKAADMELEKRAEQDRQASPAERRTSGPIAKHEREASFNTTMKEVRTQMSGPSRTFSKVIHNKIIEKVSETAGSTIARPNAILSGAVFAFILTLAVYLVAKNLGYHPLSGFETIGAFILGWIIGLTYDFLKVMITGRK